MTMNNIIEIQNLNKSYGNVKAVQDISFNVRQGELFAFLGVNGAGKSTTINMICTTLSKDSGKIIIDGYDTDTESNSVKNKLGVVFQSSVLDSALTVRDNLEHRAALYGICGTDFKKRLNELAETFQFSDLLGRTLGKLSGGQKRRIDIARALIHKPKLLVLDEPTTGLDPQTRRLIWDTVNTLRKRDNMTVFLTTHYMEEAADADYVVIIDSGKIAAKGTPLELKNSYAEDSITLYNVDEKTVKAISDSYTAIGNAYRIKVPNTSVATELIVKYPNVFVDYEIVKGKMDDVFLAVTGKKLIGGDTK